MRAATSANRGKSQDHRTRAVLDQVAARVERLQLENALEQRILDQVFTVSGATVARAVQLGDVIDHVIASAPSLTAHQERELRGIADDLIQLARAASLEAFDRARRVQQDARTVADQPGPLETLLSGWKDDWEGLKQEWTAFLQRGQERSHDVSEERSTTMPRRNNFLPNLDQPRNEMAEMPSIDSYLAGTKTDKREKQAIQEVRLRSAIVVGRAILEKMSLDERLAVRAYAHRRLDAAFSDMLRTLDEPRSKVHRQYTEDLVHNSVQELYKEIMQILRASGVEIQELIDRPLYPKDEAERQWWEELGVFISAKR